MTFDLPPNLTAFVVTVVLIAVLAALALVGLATVAVTRDLLARQNHPARVAAPRGRRSVLRAPRSRSLTPPGLGRSARAAHLRVPHALGRHGPARPRQQRHLPRLRRRGPRAPVHRTRRRPGTGAPPPGRVRRAAGVPAAARCSVDSWVTDVSEDGLTLAHEMYDAPDGRRRRRGPSTCGPRPMLDHRLTDAERARGRRAPGPGPRAGGRSPTRPVPGGDVYSLTVRRADVDEHGLARDVAFFEYFQEARIQFLMGLHTRGQQLEPPRGRAHRRRLPASRCRTAASRTPCAPGSATSARRSFTIRAEVLDDDRVLARAAVVMVIFDMETQRTDRHGRHAARAAAAGARR